MTTTPKPCTMPEAWMPVKEMLGKYQVSSLGRIKNAMSGKIVSQRIMHKGYMTVNLCHDGKQLHRRVHRLMMEAFFGCCDDKIVNHLDGNRINNILSNLEYASVRENVSHGKSCKKHVGITFLKDQRKWQSRITVGRKRVFLGSFKTEEDAHIKSIYQITTLKISM